MILKKSIWDIDLREQEINDIILESSLYLIIKIQVKDVDVAINGAGIEIGDDGFKEIVQIAWEDHCKHQDEEVISNKKRLEKVVLVLRAKSNLYQNNKDVNIEEVVYISDGNLIDQKIV